MYQPPVNMSSARPIRFVRPFGLPPPGLPTQTGPQLGTEQSTPRCPAPSTLPWLYRHKENMLNVLRFIQTHRAASCVSYMSVCKNCPAWNQSVESSPSEDLNLPRNLQLPQLLPHLTSSYAASLHSDMLIGLRIVRSCYSAKLTYHP